MAENRTNEHLSRFCNETGYVHYQINGMRSLRVPNNVMAPQGCEIFVGRLPRNIFEDQLFKLFSKAGPVLEVRLMVNYSNKNRGYAFVVFFTPDCVNRAITMFDNYEIRPNECLAVHKSLNNCRLMLSNIGYHLTREEILQFLDEVDVKGVKDVFLYKNPSNPALNRGYVFVEFGNHREAAIARRYISSSKISAGTEKRVYVDWADPIPDVDPNIMAKVMVLYLKPIPYDLSSGCLKQIISNYVNIETVEKVAKMADFAFVNFKSRKWAEEGFAALRGLKISNEFVSVDWAKPTIYNKKNRQEQVTNFCRSVPPNMRRLVHKKMREENIGSL